MPEIEEEGKICKYYKERTFFNGQVKGLKG